jgi:hypothetical protein
MADEKFVLLRSHDIQTVSVHMDLRVATAQQAIPVIMERKDITVTEIMERKDITVTEIGPNFYS